ncbi:MAG: PEP-CTERM sorting domain-containing protein, partial [Acetobacteraceae bacterium]
GISSVQKPIDQTSARAALMASAIAVGILGAPALVWAGTFTAPPGLAPGQAYRLVFETSTTTEATSTAISTYNSFVTAAAGNNSALPSTTWAAIASTADVDAVTNTACIPAGCAADPIYLVDGTEVAASLADFFAGTLLNAIDLDESGASNGGYAWTGSNSDGTADSGATLGTADPVIGIPGAGNGLYNFLLDQTDLYSLYAISAPIEVTGVPEPASWALLLTGTMLLAARRWRRHV